MGLTFQRSDLARELLRNSPIQFAAKGLTLGRLARQVENVLCPLSCLKRNG